ncbi:PREDICTED: WEB family protein At3g02930, chloroplastic-like [Fragaria vesca subsp. vesca]|uniref:WEB family protein At3g02930, chloroplastic-like n=1 Tax=Fragaria vesca subsp. vesca TaxID=101020 RepID=UPI0002C34F28|nr:PREDICTED: WEB family protein At3g02930, chloroplastic-like [Fragaria vesca subsp. vesca]
MSSKSKSTVSETPKKAASAETPKKTAVSTPRVSKLSRGLGAKSESDSASSPSPLQNSSRLSIDRSPRSVNSIKPTIERRSPKIATPPPTEKQPTRGTKGSELQAQLSLVQEDLKKAKEQIEVIEKEKAKAIDDLKEAQRVSEEANEKLREALVAQKRAQEDSEIEKFRAVELEQAGIEAAQKKEVEWEKELEAVRNQHALDVATLLSTTQELQRLRQELTMTCDAKNQALSHADDATKIAEIHAEKVEILSAELTRLKGLLESKQETEISENSKMVLQLESEVESLKQQLEKAKVYEERLMEKETSIEQLNVEVESAKMAESYARSIVEEWKLRVEELEMQVEEANKAEKSASESLDSVMKQLEGNHDLLHDAESEIAALKEKVSLLEMTIVRHRGDLEESERCLGMTKEENHEITKMVESLKSELETVKEEKMQALSNEKLAASSVQSLLEEKNKLINELEHSRDEEEKSKKAMESLASALHEVSTEAREAKEKLLTNQAEHDSYVSQIEDLKMVLKATNEKYEAIMDDAKHEIHLLTCNVEQCKTELQDAKADWEQKELHLVNSVKHSEEENTSMEKEINRLLNLLKSTEEEACAMKEEEAQLKDGMKEVESEVICLQEALAEAKAENMKLKESILDKENEFQGVIHENEELQNREAASHKKVEELSKLLEEAVAKKQAEENGELTDSEKDYDLLPKVVEFSEENGHGREEKLKVELSPPQSVEPKSETLWQDNNVLNGKADHVDSAQSDTLNGKSVGDESKEKEDDSVEVEYKMWESCKIEKKEFSPERDQEQESFEEEVDSKVDGGEKLDQINGLTSTESADDNATSPSKLQQQKKKKPLLRKFGSLLKKKGTSNNK